MKKISIIILSLLFVSTLASCNKKIVIVNEVITRNVEYSENFTINDFEDVIVEAVDTARDTIVGVIAISGLFSTETTASGVIINMISSVDNINTYYVVTNRHVVLKETKLAKEIYITLGDESERYLAHVEEYHQQLDLAILSFSTPRILSVAKVNYSTFQAGRFVIAIGNPYDLYQYYQTTTIGNISHENRFLVETTLDKTECLNSYLQHTAAINVGSSGGGLFNIQGELIGINTWKIIEENIDSLCFAIKINDVVENYPEYFATNQ